MVLSCMLQTFISKLKINIDGIRYFFREHKSSVNLFIATVIIIFGIFVLRIGRLQSEIIILHIALIWVAEMINTAIESAVNLKTKEFHLDAKIAKDVASAAVFMSYAFFIFNIIVSLFW